MKIITLKSFLIAVMLISMVPAFAQRKKATDATKEEKPAHYLDKVSLSGLKFRSVGPALTSGRIADVAVHPGNSSVYYVATASGGVWKTENNGTTFKPIFDSQGSYSIGCVTIDPNNPNIVWVGTGENNNQRSVAYGDGVYKSEDGGKSWKNVGLKNSEHIGKIIVHPENSDVVYVAAYGPLWSAGGDRGVYKTTDGGKTWEAILTIDEHTGVNDLIMDPRDPDVMYAAAHQRRRRVFTYVGGGEGSGMYKTTDGGANWEKANKGLPAGKMGRIGLAMAPSDPEIIYAIVEAEGRSGGVFVTTDRAASWEKRSGYTSSGNYYQEIVVHPNDPEMIISLNTFNQVSKDGGRTWSNLGDDFKHWDNHSLWIDPNNPDHYLAGCDGGLYETFDGAKTWIFKENLPVTQFYKVAVDNSEPFYYIYGGTQDNYSLGGPSRTTSRHGIRNADWFVTQGGDGFESQVDPRNPNIVYAQSQYGNLTRYDRASGEDTGIQPQPGKDEDEYRWNWDAPLAVSEHMPTRIYFAANKLFKSDDRGDTWQTISPDLTRQIDRNTLKVMGRVQSIDAVEKNGGVSPYGTIVAFSESPLSENLLYVGTDDGLIQVTEDGGSTWRKVEVESIGDVPERCYVNYLLASQHDENVVYAAFNNHKDGNFKPYVYKSTDKGRTWTNITSNLPERGSTYSLAEDHVAPNLLFVGTEFSCFFSNDGGGHWKQLSAGLPTIAVRDMAIQKRENDLVLGTFGRGFYVLDDYSPLRQMSEENLQADAQIFPVKDGLLYVEGTPLGTLGGVPNAFQGHTMYSADNPPVGATFTYFVKENVKTLEQKRKEEEAKKIKAGEDVPYPTYEALKAEREEEDPYLLFTIRDLDGNVIRKLTTGVRPGVNRMVWDGRMPSLNPVRANGGGGSGIMAMPADYTVSLSQSVNGALNELVAPVRFTLKSLGNVTLPAKDRAALVEFQREAAELQRAYAGANNMLDDIENRLRHMRSAIEQMMSPGTELMAEVMKVEDKVDEINVLMSGDRVASQVDAPTKPGLSSRLFGMVFSMSGSTSAPTKTNRDALRILQEEFPPVLTRIRNIMNTDIKNLETRLEAAGAPYTPGRMVEYGNN